MNIRMKWQQRLLMSFMTVLFTLGVIVWFEVGVADARGFHGGWHGGFGHHGFHEAFGYYGYPFYAYPFDGYPYYGSPAYSYPSFGPCYAFDAYGGYSPY